MHITLIRHTSVDVPKGTCYGFTDVPVADTFEQEAALTKQRLKGMRFDQVYSSTLTRARKLAFFCGYPHHILDNRLKEMNMGDWEMRTYEEIEKEDPSIKEWYDDFLHLPTTNGESFAQLYQRVADFLDELRTKPYEHVAIFAHGGVLLCAGVYAGLFSEEDCFKHQVDYGGIEQIEI